VCKVGVACGIEVDEVKMKSQTPFFLMLICFRWGAGLILVSIAHFTRDSRRRVMALCFFFQIKFSLLASQLPSAIGNLT